MSIQRLNQGTPTSASQIPFYDPINGVDRRCSVDQLADAMGLGEGAEDGWVTQYANPNASGFGVTIAPPVDGQSTWLLLMPTGSFAAGTIDFPDVAKCRDRQEIEILCSQDLTAVTYDGNGAAIVGAINSFTAFQSVKMRFDIVTKTWYPAT